MLDPHSHCQNNHPGNYLLTYVTQNKTKSEDGDRHVMPINNEINMSNFYNTCNKLIIKQAKVSLWLER